MAPAALGTQTQGSILRPASYCGVVGFKPTFGALNAGGVHLVSPTNDHLGVIAATVEDAWSVAAQISIGGGSPGVGLMSGAGAKTPAPRQPQKLIRLYTRGWDETDAPTRNAFNEAIERLKARGIEIASRYDDPEVADLEEQLEHGIDGQRDIMAYEMLWPFGDYLARHRAQVGPQIRELLELGHHVSPAGYEALLANRQRMQQIAARVLTRCNGFATLAASGPAPVGLTFTGSRTFPSYASWLGLPAFSLPLMTVKAMPVGLQLIGGAGADGALCAAARWVMGSGSR
jgi:Asp-tRNA(Asn)/Glu-tRNA(Gln) amidotransferase A subunit family amidase